MKPEPLRVASPRFARKRLILSGLCDDFFVLKYGVSSPLMRCEPPNYFRRVKGKNRNSVCVRVRARAFSPVSPTLLLASAWVSDAMEAIGEKLPDKSKKCPRPEPFAPPFFGRNGVARASAGVARRLCRSVPPWDPPRAPPASRALAHLGRCAVRGRTEQPMQEPQPRRPPAFCPFSPFRGRRSLFLRPLFLKSGQREGLFREK